MKIRNLTRTVGSSKLHVWPPSIVAGAGTTLFRPGEGVLKSVRRIGDRLALTIEHEGRQGSTGIECDSPPTLETIEKVLRAHIGESVVAIGELDIPT